MQEAATSRRGKRFVDLLKTRWHWLFIALALALVLVRYMPADYLAVFCSDNVQGCMLYRDVIDQGHSAYGWIFGGHSDLFPDVTLVFLLRFLLRNELLALQVLGSILFAAWVAICLVLYRQLRGRRIEILAVFLALFFLGCCRNFGVNHGFGFHDSFVMGIHCGTEIMSLLCLALCLHSAIKGRGRSFWWLAAACFITAASDPFFMVLFPIPFLAALFPAWLAYPGKIRSLLPLAANIAFFSAFGLVMGPRISPPEIIGGYTHPDLALARLSLQEILRDCVPSHGGLFVIFFALDLLFMIGGLCMVIPPCSRFIVKRIPASAYLLLLFCASVIACDLGASILTGNYSTLGAGRYLRFAFWVPPLVLIAWFNHWIPWPEIAGKIVAAIVSLLIAGFAIFSLPQPDFYYVNAQKLIPVMHSLMEKEGIEAGLADYWWANVFTFLSHDDVKLRSVTPGGSMFHWLNNTSWFAGSPPSTPPPKFRMIFMLRLDAEQIKLRYGAPDRIVTPLPGQEIWLYREDRGISCNPIFGDLSNTTPANEYQVKARQLPTQTGGIEGDSIVARAGRSPQGAITFGPYIHPSPGRYRIEVAYAWLAAPAPGKAVTYDVIIWKGPHAVALDAGDVPFIDTAPHEISREVRIPERNHGFFEVRTFYHGSGDIRVDSLRIVYLGP